MKEHTLGELATLTGSKLVGNANHVIKGVADLESATAEDVSFLANPRYEKAMLGSGAGAVFITPETPAPAGRNFLVTSNPSEAFQIVVHIFYKDRRFFSAYTGVHPTAVIHSSAIIGESVTIGPHAVIDKNVSIGKETTISAGCYIGPGVVIGMQCFLHPHVTIREFCRLGDRVTLQPGAVVGSCGYGYLQDSKGRHTKLEQLGYVELGDDVEVGANTTIDRARFKKTSIGRGTKIDNQVQIAHGVKIGEHSLIISQTGIAGSTTLGNHVIIAGQVGIAGHLTICNNAMIAARCGVSKSILKPGKYGGTPNLPLHEHNRNMVLQRNIDAYVKKIQDLEERVEALTKKITSNSL